MSVEAFVYNAELVKVVDGDTVDVTLDLGFDVKLHKQRCRLAGIDTPESRTRNLEEKKLGLAAKKRLQELCFLPLGLGEAREHAMVDPHHPRRRRNFRANFAKIGVSRPSRKF